MTTISPKGRWGIHQIDLVTGKVTGGTIGGGYYRLIDAQVACVRGTVKAVFSRCDFIPFDRFPREESK